MARLVDSIFAAPEATRPQIRRAGFVRLAIGLAIGSAAFAFAARDGHASHGLLAAHGGLRIVLALVVAASTAFALGGAYGALFGLARGAEVESRAVRTAQGVFALVAIAGVFASLVVFLGISAPDERSFPTANGTEFRLPGPNERSVTYQVGDGAITIERVVRDGRDE
jgi:hypothetical protein